jgi:hypothetical protein
MDGGVHLHSLALIIGVPEGECRGKLLGFEPVQGQGCEEMIPLTLDGVLFFGNGNVPPGQFFMHEIHNERVFDGFPTAFGFRGFISG